MALAARLYALQIYPSEKVQSSYQNHQEENISNSFNKANEIINLVLELSVFENNITVEEKDKKISKKKEGKKHE